MNMFRLSILKHCPNTIISLKCLKNDIFYQVNKNYSIINIIEHFYYLFFIIFQGHQKLFNSTFKKSE